MALKSWIRRSSSRPTARRAGFQAVWRKLVDRQVAATRTRKYEISGTGTCAVIHQEIREEMRENNGPYSVRLGSSQEQMATHLGCAFSNGDPASHEVKARALERDCFAPTNASKAEKPHERSCALMKALGALGKAPDFDRR